VKRSLAVCAAVTLLLLTAIAAFGQVTLPSLTSISVSPSTPSIPVRLTQQFMAIGHFSHGTSRDLTQVVVWSSSTGVATVSNTFGTQGLRLDLALNRVQLPSFGSLLDHRFQGEPGPSFEICLN